MSTETLNNKNILITGATEGIGRATAGALAAMGANLYLLCRNNAKAEALRAELLQSHPDIDVRILLADLGDFDQVRRAAGEFLALEKPLHVLINNAGVFNTSRILMPNGLEQMFVVNHLGHFLLTQCLLPALRRAEAARIVVVASGAHAFCEGIRFDNLAWDTGFKPFKTYGHSKLANILFMRSLAERLRGESITVNALHPGAVSSGLGGQNTWWAKYLLKLLSLVFKTPGQGAATSVYLASAPEVAGVTGEYFIDCKQADTKPWAKDMQEAGKLWQLSESLVRQ